MIIGILQCDSIKTEYRDEFDNYPQMFQGLFQRVAADIETIIYNVEQGEYPQDIEACDAYITTGSKTSVYEDLAWIQTLQAFIVRLYEQNKKLVAVCFGHQLVAQALGGKTQKSDKGWGVGVQTMQLQLTKPWMTPAKDAIKLIVSHQDQVISLPKGAELIAGNTFCPNSMYVLNDCILGIQGHPEFSSDYAAVMMRQRRTVLGDETFRAGMATLQKPTDELLIAKWMLQFIQG